MAKAELSLDHLAWAVESRARNQRSCLRLLTLLRTYEHFWITQDLSKATQDLIGIAFSLWRAAFLADKKGKRETIFAHGVDFLEKVIESNAISFATDMNSNEWTFNYYTKNARSSLTLLANRWPGLPLYEGGSRTPTSRWNYCQNLFDQMLDGFEKILIDKTNEVDRMEAARVKRDQTKANRARSGKPPRVRPAKQ